MKLKCTGYKRDERYFTIGKIYEIKNGKLTADNGYTYGKYITYTDEDLLKFLSDWYKFEPVNECIVIYRKGNEVIALDKSTGKKAVAKCSSEDTFDFMTGAKLAFERLNSKKYDTNIKVGDRVKVTDCMESYPLYVEWVEINVRNARDLRYKLDYENRPDETHNYEVKRIAKHLSNNDILAYIEDCVTNRCYVISVEGLEKC